MHIACIDGKIKSGERLVIDKIADIGVCSISVRDVLQILISSKYAKKCDNAIFCYRFF